MSDNTALRRSINEAIEQKRYAREVGRWTMIVAAFVIVEIAGFAAGLLHGAFLAILAADVTIWFIVCLSIAWKHRRLFAKTRE